MNLMDRYEDRDPDNRVGFRNAYVLKAGKFDFSSLKPYCERIIFVTDGYGDHVDNLREQVIEHLQHFHPDKDVIIPIGSPMVGVLAGQLMQRYISEKQGDSYAMGIFLEGRYHFWRISCLPWIESYKIILD